MKGEMECERGPFLGHAHGIVLEVGEKVDVDEVVGKVHMGEDPFGKDDIGVIVVG